MFYFEPDDLEAEGVVLEAWKRVGSISYNVAKHHVADIRKSCKQKEQSQIIHLKTNTVLNTVLHWKIRRLNLSVQVENTQFGVSEFLVSLYTNTHYT